MINIILAAWFFIIFIVGIYWINNLLRCIDYSKFTFEHKQKEVRILVTLLSVILAFVLAMGLTYIAKLIIDLIFM